MLRGISVANSDRLFQKQRLTHPVLTADNGDTIDDGRGRKPYLYDALPASAQSLVSHANVAAVPVP
jgi:hypothetical protein